MKSGATPESVQRLAAKCVDRFELELINHFELEETLLFPAIVRELGTVPLVERLIAEHREMERLAAALQASPR